MHQKHVEKGSSVMFSHMGWVQSVTYYYFRTAGVAVLREVENYGLCS